LYGTINYIGDADVPLRNFSLTHWSINVTLSVVFLLILGVFFVEERNLCII